MITVLVIEAPTAQQFAQALQTVYNDSSISITATLNPVPNGSGGFICFVPCRVNNLR